LRDNHFEAEYVSTLLAVVSKGENIMRVVETIHLDETTLKAKDRNTLFTLSCAIFSIVFLVAIYAASTSPGTASGDFASMSVFP
jgi:hypothetical protein